MSILNNMENNQVIFISGTPCTGKTTIATELNQYLLDNDFNTCFIKINDFAIENDLVLGEDPDKFYKVIDIDGLNQSLNEEINGFLNKNSVEESKTSIEESENHIGESDSNGLKKEKSKTIVIVEGHLSHLCKGADKMIVLRLNPIQLRKRLEERNYSESKIQENLEAEALAVCSAEAYDLYPENSHEIDVTDKSINETLDLILKIISDKLESPLGTVDFMYWLLE